MNKAPLSFLKPRLLLALSAALLFSASVQVRAQDEDSSAPQEMGAADARQDGPPEDKVNPLRLLNLSPDQVRQIREIRTQSEPEGRQLLRRLNAARRALDIALYADDADEALIQQRAHEFAEAQSAVTRLRTQIEWRVRRVLTPTQLSTLRELRLRAQRERQQERRERRGPQAPPRNAFGKGSGQRPNANDNNSPPPRLPLQRLRRRGLIPRQL